MFIMKETLFLVFVLVTGITLTTACSVGAKPTVLNSSNRLSSTDVPVQLQIDNKIPEKLYPCLPRQAQKLELRAHINENEIDYYLVGIQQLQQSDDDDTPAYQETVVELDDIGCSIIVPREKSHAVSLTRYIPEEVAHQLKLQRFQQAIKQTGGKEKFQQLLLEDEKQSESTSYFFPEDAWALKKLGIRLPNNAQIVEDINQLYLK